MKDGTGLDRCEFFGVQRSPHSTFPQRWTGLHLFFELAPSFPQTPRDPLPKCAQQTTPPTSPEVGDSNHSTAFPPMEAGCSALEKM
ncbi:hypothetical protein DSM3645_01385 [Blastopirellula marina DSM 3645]|uniref:Uncharacterized protein n=1 Tax=Blastopirellula marina DSM 3645 TaxID=314230 RepID=A3ZMZ6_9BACT|nr:hypothetical protein DSM3645_01385 [Blastopirellula marina DSM 3645]